MKKAMPVMDVFFFACFGVVFVVFKSELDRFEERMKVLVGRGE